jgi:hypothetical protein
MYMYHCLKSSYVRNFRVLECFSIILNLVMDEYTVYTVTYTVVRDSNVHGNIHAAMYLYTELVSALRIDSIIHYLGYLLLLSYFLAF